MNKTKSKEVKQQLPQTYETSIKNVFVHPATCLYVLISVDNTVLIYDLPTLSVVGASLKKFISAYEPRFCIFTSNINKFYTISRTICLNRYELNSNHRLSEKNIISVQYPFEVVAVSEKVHQQMIQILTPENFIIFSVSGLSPFKIEFKELKERQSIVDGKNIADHQWIIATDQRIMMIYLNYRQNSIQIQNLTQMYLVMEKPKLYIDCKRKLVSFLNESILSVYESKQYGFIKIFEHKIPYNKNLKWVCFNHFGTSTSTINKYENTIIIMISLKSQSSSMVEEKKQNGGQTEAFVIDLNDLNDYDETKQHPVKFMKGIKGQPWHSQFMENKINFLTEEGELQSMDLLFLVEGKQVGKEWVNLSYRFEALEENELYEQQEDEFERVLYQKGKNEVTHEQWNDWSECLFSKEELKKLSRLNCFQF